MRRPSMPFMIVIALATVVGTSLSSGAAVASTPHGLRIATGGSAPVNWRTGLPAGITPTHRQLARATAAAPSMPIWRNASVQQSAATSYGLKYRGGPVVSDVQVQPVLWGSGTYIPAITSTTAPNMQSFFSAVTAVPYLGQLAQYSTPVVGGTGQTIGAGSVSAPVQITPASPANGAVVTDAQIQQELFNQIVAGNVPQPTLDAQNLENTTYTLYFPANVTICDDSALTECSGPPPGAPGEGPVFCGYHSSVGIYDNNSNKVGDLRYIVLPDPTSYDWLSGCGSRVATNYYTALQSVASHELAEVITDPEIGEATADGPPIGWYDGNGTSSDPGEVGDICDTIQNPGQDSTFTGGDSQSYTVQNVWSNHQGNCVPGPFTRMTSPTSPMTLTGSATVNYGATDEVTSNPLTYDVAYKSAAWNGKWGTLTALATRTSATHVSLPLHPGTDYCVVARAHDTLGNVSAWSAPRCTASPLDDTALKALTSGWTRIRASSAYRGTLTRTGRVGSKLSLTGAVTNRLALAVETCRACGKIQIYLGNALWRTVSTYASTTHVKQILLPGTFSLRTTSVVLRSASGLILIDGLGFARSAPTF